MSGSIFPKRSKTQTDIKMGQPLAYSCPLGHPLGKGLHRPDWPHWGGHKPLKSFAWACFCGWSTLSDPPQDDQGNVIAPWNVGVGYLNGDPIITTQAPTNV